MKEKQRQKKWAEFVKKQHDFDYGYMLELINFKLKMMRKCITDNDLIVDAGKVAGQICDVEKILKRVIANEYDEVQIEKINKKFGITETNFNWFDNDKNTKRLSIEHVGLKEEDNEEYSKAFGKAYKRAHKNRVKDLKTAFNLIAENCWGWWD